jgi:hypothetical protein
MAILPHGTRHEARCARVYRARGRDRQIFLRDVAAQKFGAIPG